MRWSQGASARQISRELGAGISRSAVLGKIHRLGIAQFAPYDRRYDEARSRRAPRAAKYLGRAPVPPQGRVELTSWIAITEPYRDDPTLDAGIPPAQRRSLLELTGETCRWPVGDPARADFFFCGAPPIGDGPYCAEHHLRARAPTTRFKRGSRP
jgi:GcrA cell cycle regulator